MKVIEHKEWTGAQRLGGIINMYSESGFLDKSVCDSVPFLFLTKDFCVPAK